MGKIQYSNSGDIIDFNNFKTNIYNSNEIVNIDKIQVYNDG